jgi:hypothetical protein
MNPTIQHSKVLELILDIDPTDQVQFFCPKCGANSGGAAQCGGACPIETMTAFNTDSLAQFGGLIAVDPGRKISQKIPPVDRSVLVNCPYPFQVALPDNPYVTPETATRLAGPNTRLTYSYTDGTNFKARGTLVIEGIMAWIEIDRIAKNLVNRYLFNPEWAGMEPLYPSKPGIWDDRLDARLHALEAVALTEDAPTSGSPPITTIIDRFQNATWGITGNSGSVKVITPPGFRPTLGGPATARRTRL